MTLIQRQGGGLKGIAYLNVSQGGRILIVTPQVSSFAFAEYSSWIVCKPLRRTGQNCSQGELLNNTVYLYSAGRLKSLLFDWQELFIGLVPSELLGAGPSPAQIYHLPPELGVTRGCLCGPLLPQPHESGIPSPFY